MGTGSPGRTLVRSQPSTPNRETMSLDVLLVRRWPERRPVVLTAAVAGYAAVFAATRLADDPSLAVGVLHVLPVMLVALELGLVGGLAAAALAACLVVAGEPQLDALGIATHFTAFLAVGAISGRFSDRMRSAHSREQRLLDSGLALSEAHTGAELAAAVAEAALRTPGAIGAVVVIGGSETVARGRTDGERATAAIKARGAHLGSITVVLARAPSREDEAAVELLALQAGLAADNQRLRARERDATALGTQLRMAREELREHRAELGHVLADQEDERRRVAEVLHEDLAQALAGVLLGLRMLRRDGTAGGLDDVHGQVLGVLDDVREVATALRPSSLAQLGLVPALEGLGREHGSTLTVRADAVPETFPEPLRTGVFRLIQQALAAGRGAPAQLRLDASADSLDVDLEFDVDDPPRLAATRARVAVLGGSLRVEPLPTGRTRLRVRLPFDSESISG